jgi:hypothetical protein
VLDGLVIGATQARVAGVAFGPTVNAAVALVVFGTMLVVLRRRRSRSAGAVRAARERAGKR